MSQLNGSIVLYHTDENIAARAIKSFLQSNLSRTLFLIDNSKKDGLRKLEKLDSRIKYIFTGKNLGYGKAHNIALKRSIESNVKYHLILNPDVYFEKGVLEKLYEFMEANSDVGLVMPKVLYPDGSLQYLCKLLPTPFDLFRRRLLNFDVFKKLNEKRNFIFELRFTEYKEIMDVPFLSGCFMFIRTEVLKQIGIFDERFFLYLDDTDLSRRIHKISRTVFYPYVHIYHEWGRGSYKSFKLLFYHIKDAFSYFNKWGWVFDKERVLINRSILEKLEYKRSR